MTAAGAPFGALLRRLRKEAGLTQEELAQRAGISVRGISDLERGVNRTARGDTARLLADGLALRGEERTRFLDTARGRAALTPSRLSVSLPVPPTPLIGRTAEVAAVLDLLAHSHLRLVTLTGVGGTGKTRLAFEVAARAEERFPDGVHFVDLAPLTDATTIAAAVAQSLGVREAADATIEASLVAFLEQRALLLILDNFERVVAGAPFVASLLARCPTLTVLATSRVPLRLRGEHLYAVPALALPDRSRLSLEGAQSDAVSLFVERLRAVQPDFRLTPANLTAVAEICHRLDGLPLAIELAAARGNILSPSALLGLLDHRLSLLTGGARDAPPRQRTLHDTIAWSHDLLPPREKTMFRRLGVFVGGFTLEAAEAVAGGRAGDGRGTQGNAGRVTRTPQHDHPSLPASSSVPRSSPCVPLPSPSALDLIATVDQLSSLVEWSLVQRSDGEQTTRFRMLETVREFAVAELAGSDDETGTRRRHAHYFTRFAEAAAPHLRSGDQRVWLDRLDQEHDNLRAALSWTLRRGDAETAQRLCGALALFWRIRGHYDEGRRWCAQALASDAATPPAVRARALHGHGMLAHWQGDYGAAQSLYEASLALWREIGDAAGLALTLNSLGILADDVGDYERALAWQTESLRSWERAGEPWGIAHALCDIGNIAKIQGREAEALPLYRRSLEIFEHLRDEHGIALVLDNMGEVAMRQRAYAQAATLFEEALRIQRTLNQPQFVSRHLHKLGMAMLALGDIERAEALQEESLHLRRAIGDRRGIAFSLMQLGDVARERGDTEVAAARYRESLRLRWSIGHRDGVVACLEELAATVAESRPRSAARLFGASAAMRKEIAAPMPASRQAVFERGISRAQCRLGAKAFAEAWSEGETCDPEMIVVAALDPAFWLEETG